MDQALILSAVVSAGALVGTLAGRVLKARTPAVIEPEPERDPIPVVDLDALLAVYDTPTPA